MNNFKKLWFQNAAYSLCWRKDKAMLPDDFCMFFQTE